MIPNVSQVFIHNFPVLGYVTIFNCSPCGGKKCEKCPFVNNTSKLKLDSDFIFNIKCKSNCNTKNCIYIIICKKYFVFYIDETDNTVRNRMTNHLNNISNRIMSIYLN
jgi:hypothetical protein